MIVELVRSDAEENQEDMVDISLLRIRAYESAAIDIRRGRGFK